MAIVWMLTENRQLIAYEIEKANEIFTLVPKDLKERWFPLGDIETRLLNKSRDGDADQTGVYLLFEWNDHDDANEGNINVTAARILLDVGLLEPPYIAEKNTEKLIKKYFQAFPKRNVVFYKMKGDELVTYGRQEFLHDWSSFFKENTPYMHLASARYVDHTQPLLECAKSQSAKFEFRSTCQSLLEVFLKETPKNSVTQRDRFHRMFLGASLVLLYGFSDWKKLTQFPKL